MADESVRKFAIITAEIQSPLKGAEPVCDIEHLKQYLDQNEIDTRDILSIKVEGRIIYIVANDENRIFYGKPADKMIGQICFYKTEKCKLTKLKIVRMVVAGKATFAIKGDSKFSFDQARPSPTLQR